MSGISSNTQFNYNPFSVEYNDDINSLIEPQFDIDIIQKILNSKSSRHIELVGRKGRGKSTHLKWIADHFPQYPLFILDANSETKDLMESPADIIFLDSIHHLPLLKRLSLLKSKKNILFTTHWTRRIECMAVGSNLHSIKVKGIEAEILKIILNKRLTLASQDALKEDDLFSSSEARDLIKTHKDDYRAIIYQMYDKYQL